MSAPDDPVETFLRRWSRRKQAAQADEATPPASSEAVAPRQVAAPGESEPFDPATLPPLESITAASDLRAFLAPGVPEELARAALRRAWVSDPVIRDFIGLAENQWDFTKTDGVPGFGVLEVTAQLRRMAARLIGDAAPPSDGASEPDGQIVDKVAETSSPAAAGHTAQGSTKSGHALGRQSDPVDVAEQQNPAEPAAALSARRQHGGALPK